MSAEDQQVHDSVMQQAADWVVANRAVLSGREREAFVAWLKVSPVHVEEYLGVATVARDLREACAELAASTDSLVALARAAGEEPTPIRSSSADRSDDVRAPPSFISVPGFAAVALLALALLGWWSLGFPGRGRPSAGAAATLHFATRHGEQQTYRLPDASILHLNTDTSVTVRLGAAERLVILESGEADFEVAHQPQRRFRVLAGSAQVLDLGTQFDVRLEADAAVITVVEGRIAVGPSSSSVGMNSAKDAPPGFVELTANQQIRVAQSPPAAPVAVDAQGTTSWMRRQISFEHEPLSRVAQEINRYAPKPIVITTPALGNLQISGVFATDDTSEFIAFLRSMKGVHVEVTESLILVTQE